MVDYKRKLLKLFVPFMLSQVLSLVQLLIDRIFVGHLGIAEMSAIGNATAPLWTTLNFVFSLGIGASILVSQSVGAGDIKQARTYAASILKYHNIISLLLFVLWFFFSRYVYRLMGVPEGILESCVDYSRYYSPIFILVGAGAALIILFQSSNYTRPLILYGLLRSGLNVFLDWVLIFGNLGASPMGVKGAALATTISEYAGGIYALVYIIFSKKLLTKPDFKEIIKAPFKTYLRELKLGVPASAEDLASNFASLIILSILNAITQFAAPDDKVRLAAAGIYSTVLTMQILLGGIIGSIGSATVTLTGEATGSRDLSLFRNILKTALTWSLCIVGTAVLVVCIIPKQILSVLSEDKFIIESSVLYLILITCNMFCKAGNIITGSAIRGYGDTRWMFLIQLFGTVCVSVVAAVLVFVFGFGITGVIVAMMIDEAVRLVINFMKFLSIKFQVL